MSWSFSFQADSADQVNEKGTAAMEVYTEGWDATDEHDIAKEQMETAIECAATIAGVVGKRQFQVSLSGHANPNHEPRQGYANEITNVSVSEVVREAEAPQV